MRCTRPRSACSASTISRPFSTLSARKSPEKTLDQLDVLHDGREIIIVTSARSIPHSQVRSMVGSLVWVGEGRWTADDLSAALGKRATAPPAVSSRRRRDCI